MNSNSEARTILYGTAELHEETFREAFDPIRVLPAQLSYVRQVRRTTAL